MICLRTVPLLVLSEQCSIIFSQTFPIKISMSRTLIFELFVLGWNKCASLKSDSILNRLPYISSALWIVRFHPMSLINNFGPPGVHSQSLQKKHPRFAYLL